ncbi:MAG: putative periplasmic trehalase [Candidatus Saccharibacteria bacterium]|nr:putative periplasmic trehalase [Candidatus Saccharibacteria bacterium]
MVARKIPKLSSIKMPRVPREDAIKSALVNTAGALMLTRASPDEALGELFSQVQQHQVYDDGKTFIDLIPRKRMKQIKKEYLLEKQDPNFDLHEFVGRHFYAFQHTSPTYESNPDHTPREHIKELWTVLERRNRRDRGSLIALPYPYVVPGGRFSEQYYWDSYFTMLGLAADHRWDMIEYMIKNATYMIRKFGFIPTANRTYYLSRSQPPVFSHMVKLLASHRNRTLTLLEYLPYMLSEYQFWIKGRKELSREDDAAAFRRVVRLPDGSMLGRYFDNKTTPRPESLREDVEAAEQASHDNIDRMYLDLRAGAESGWDFSSRWFSDVNEINTIHTTDIVAVDLNSLLYHLESTIAETYQLMYQPLLARKFRRFAEHRKAAMSRYLWDDDEQFFVDYDFQGGKNTGQVTLAGVFPLFTKIATPAQAQAVATRIERDFLKKGGLLTTLVENGQQWDSPNGWAPLQWVAIQGLREYGHHELANRIKKAWIDNCIGVYKSETKMVEKYNVIHPEKLGDGGEYTLQDGFGWTNGVLAALLNEDSKN